VTKGGTCRGKVMLTALAAVTCLAAGCGAAVPALPRLAPGDTVLAFGDSLTAGTGAQPPEAYPAVLETLIGHRVVAAGVPGEVTDAGRRRLPGVLDATRPAILLLCLGGNDMLRRVDSATTAANLRAMVQLARDRGVHVVLIGLPKPPLFPGTVEHYATIADEFDLPFENSILRTLLFDASTRSDLIHPNALGYRRMAEAIAALLRQAGAIA